MIGASRSERAARLSDRYVQFVRAIADSIWNQDQGPDYVFGLVWSGPFNPDSNAAASQTSALDAIIAAAEMSQTVWTTKRNLALRPNLP